MLNRRIAAALMTVVLATPTFAAAESHSTEAEESSMTEEQKALYALGMLVSGSLATFDLSPEEVELIQRGMTDTLLGNDTHGVNPMQFQEQLQALAKSRSERMAKREKDGAAEFLAAAAAEPGAEKTESGLIYSSIEEGEGESPEATDRVSVHYHGTLRDGTVFDSSVDRGEPATFGLNQVIPCWTEGVAKMKVGGKAKLVCPSDIAYGDRGAPGGVIKPGAALTFEVELLEIVEE